MRDKLFEEFKKYARDIYGYEIANVDSNKALTFEKLFGGSFIENEQLLRLPDANIDILASIEYLNVNTILPNNLSDMGNGCIISDVIAMAA